MTQLGLLIASSCNQNSLKPTQKPKQTHVNSTKKNGPLDTTHFLNGSRLRLHSCLNNKNVENII